MKGTIYLIPNLLGDASVEASLPPQNIEIVQRLKHFAVESEKSARKFLKLCGVMPPFEGINFYLLDKRSKPDELQEILTKIGRDDIGILSEAGCPAVADPGANLVNLGHQKEMVIKPLVGPSSVLLAVMASGMNGQGFSFHGYLPVQSNERMQKIRELEADSATTGYMHLFIETPFRNQHLLEDIIKNCRQNTMLSVACDLTLPTEEIKTMNVESWRKSGIDLKNRQAIFSLWVIPKRRSNKPKSSFHENKGGSFRRGHH